MLLKRAGPGGNQNEGEFGQDASFSPVEMIQCWMGCRGIILPGTDDAESSARDVKPVMEDLVHDGQIVMKGWPDRRMIHVAIFGCGFVASIMGIPTMNSA
jgi:hypothetical protein